MSRTYVVAAEGRAGMSGLAEVPDFITFPGRYITELPPSKATGSTIDQVCEARLRTWVAMGVFGRGGSQYSPVGEDEHVRVIGKVEARARQLGPDVGLRIVDLGNERVA